MKLHANAALSWSGRRLLAERVVVEGWTLAAAAAAAGISVRCARKWVCRCWDQCAVCQEVGLPLPAGGCSRLAGSLLGAEASRKSHAGRSGRCDRGLAPAADDGGRDRRD